MKVKNTRIKQLLLGLIKLINLTYLKLKLYILRNIMIYNLIRDIGIKYLRLGLLKLIKLINLTFDLSFKYFFI